MLAHILGIIVYFLIAIFVKSYYKLHRYNDPLEVMKEEPYLIGLGWPIYLVYRLVAWPYISGSRYLEAKMLKLQEEKKTNIRISYDIRDQDLEEAEQEVESMLSKERSL